LRCRERASKRFWQLASDPGTIILTGVLAANAFPDRAGDVGTYPRESADTRQLEVKRNMLDKSTIRILIIDDDIEYCNVLRMHLSGAGYAAEIAEDGVEGGKAVLARPPNLILCDIKMPHLNGFELAALMRADECSAMIPVIFISGRNDAEIINEAVKLGAADFLLKPITREDLLKSVEACLETGGRRPFTPDVGFPPVV
jgi:PleD family two-component response regulator